MTIKYDGCILNWEIIGRELMMAEEGHFQWQVICYGDVTEKYDLDKMKEAKGVILDTQSAMTVVGLVFLSWFMCCILGQWTWRDTAEAILCEYLANDSFGLMAPP